MKKLTKALILALAVSALTLPTLASTISLRINNQLVAPTVAPFEQNGTTLVPLRIVSENLGAKVEWNQKAQLVTILDGDKTIELTIGSKVAKVNGENKTLNLAPQVKNGTTMVPIRFVSENLDCTVNWDKATQTVSVNDKETEYEASKGEKVTTFKNPKVINGHVYLTGEQLEKALDVKIEKVDSKNATLSRQDFHCWLRTEEFLKKTYNRMNWAFVPRTGNNDDTLVYEGKTAYFPINFLAKYTNAETTYNTSTRELTVVYKGLKIYETVDEPANSIGGHVTLPNGNSAPEGIVVYLSPNGTIIQDDFLYTVTDKSGNYVFENIDIHKINTFTIGVNAENTSLYKKETHNYIGSPMKYITTSSKYDITDYDACIMTLRDKANFDIQLYSNIW